jgi:hypothetical protein
MVSQTPGRGEGWKQPLLKRSKSADQRARLNLTKPTRPINARHNGRAIISGWLRGQTLRLRLTTPGSRPKVGKTGDAPRAGGLRMEPGRRAVKREMDVPIDGASSGDAITEYYLAFRTALLRRVRLDETDAEDVSRRSSARRGGKLAAMTLPARLLRHGWLAWVTRSWRSTTGAEIAGCVQR